MRRTEEREYTLNRRRARERGRRWKEVKEEEVKAKEGRELRRTEKK